MKARFLKPNNPKLKQASKQADLHSPETQKIIKVMLEMAQKEQKGKKKPIMVGLAAPQIGIFKRIILVDTKADGKGSVGDLRIYINPEIIWQSQKKGEWYEGCFSTGNIYGIVSRPTSIKIQAFSLGVHTNPPPRCITEKFTGYTARIFQHEIDHLNGAVFINHITNPDHLHLVEEKEFPLYRNKGAWKNWPKKASLMW